MAIPVFFSVLVVSLISLIGVTALALSAEKLKKFLFQVQGTPQAFFKQLR